jgi:hypothetical protein
MKEIVTCDNVIPNMNDEMIEKVRKLETSARLMPQVEIETQHLIHGGMYARTIKIPSGILLTGALIKIATILIIQGDVIVYIGEKSINLTGYNVIPASSNRKQAYLTNSETFITMVFPSKCDNITEAEKQFTDEVDLLISNNINFINTMISTGEV